MQRYPKTRPSSFRRALLKWYRENGRQLPWRQTRDPYRILVSEVMLQQTTVATVLPRYHAWLERFPTLGDLARASENDVLHAWQGLGYYTRARNLHRCAQTVVQEENGLIPCALPKLRSLPGIGRYTTNAVRVFAFNRADSLVEANTARVLARLHNFREPIDAAAGSEQLWRYSAALVARQKPRDFHNALMDLGALICLAAKPRCELCPVKRFCRATDPGALPRKKARVARRHLTERHELVGGTDSVLLAPATRRWRGLWILPPTTNAEAPVLHRSVFPFTHHRITLEVVRVPDRPPRSPERVFRRDELEQIPMPSPHRRAVAALL